MTPFGRVAAEIDGQLPPEFRRRDPSGYLVVPPPALLELIADVGHPCWTFGPTSAAMHRMDGYVLKPPFHLLTLRDRNVRRIGHAIHTTTDLPLIDRAVVSGVPVTSAARTLIDLSATESTDRLTTALDAAVRDGLVTDDFLHRRIAALRGRGTYGIPKLLDVIEGIELTRGGQTWLERTTLRLIAEAGLPRPDCQVVLGRRRNALIRVDFRFPGSPVVVEALGYRPHRSARQHSIDVERATRLTLDGFVVLQFTYTHVVAEPEFVVATLREALARFDRPTAV